MPTKAVSLGVEHQFSKGRSTTFGAHCVTPRLPTTKALACSCRQWRSSDDTTAVDRPERLYCKLLQDSPISVRGARNYPCMGHPGRHASTGESVPALKSTDHSPCASMLPAYPHSTRAWSRTASPPDDRITFGDNVFTPIRAPHRHQKHHRPWTASNTHPRLAAGAYPGGFVTDVVADLLPRIRPTSSKLEKE
jgi:hypothetical protein